MSNDTDRRLAETLFRFSMEVQKRVAATDFPSGWEWHMHPGTWNRIRRDVEMAKYITPNSEEPFAKSDDLLGCVVALDMAMPFGAVELRFADQIMLPLA
ncbi:MAG: hypothetical protein JWO15_3856 [Sphingomonadales bacterium]|nr:hypothetical protein [Sphingomonadales bacterium]